MNGGPPGDLYVVVNLKPHPVFQREGADLHCEMPISFATAALGGEIEIPTLDGHAKIKIPPETQTRPGVPPAQQGHPPVRGSVTGDLFCHVAIETPVKLTARQKELLREFEAINEDDPGAHNPRAKWFMDKVRDFFGPSLTSRSVRDGVRTANVADPADLRRRRDRRRRRRHDVRGAGGATRPPRAADRALSHARREDPHLRRRPLQLHQHRREPARTTCRRIPISAAPRSRGTRPRDFIALVERHGIAYHEKKLGQLFCDDTAQRHHRDAEGRVRSRAASNGGCRARSQASSARRRVSSSTTARRHGPRAARSSSPPAASPSRRSARRRSATRSPSSSGSPSCRRARRSCRSPSRPNGSRDTAISRGSRSTSRSSCNGGRFRENLLFTHRGLSGPAILQISSYWDGKSPLAIDLLPVRRRRAWFRDQRASTAQIDNVLAQRLPRRFARGMVRGARRDAGR